MDLEGKVALVTGAARGIGRASAIELARAGADLAICDILELEETSIEVRKLARVLCFKTDVSSSFDVEKMVQETIVTFGKIDILVNNAAIYRTTPVLNITEEEWERVLAVNLKGTFLCSKAVLKGMVKRRYGKIVNLSSIDYLRGSSPGHLHYGSSKAAVTGFTRTLAREVGAYGVNVNAVAPGVIETDMSKELLEKYRLQWVAEIALGRIGKAEDVAKVILFLASDESIYLTGQTINVNGGWIGGMN